MSGIEYGETWVYEGILGVVPGRPLGTRAALTIQFLVFEAAILLLAWVYQLRAAAVAGTVAVGVATVGSAELVRIASRIRDEDVPEPYRQLIFGSNVEVVLAIFAFIGLVTHLLVVDPRSGEPLVETLLGEDPPAPAVFLMLLILWDVCYRIGAGWWASVTAAWRSARYPIGSETVAPLMRADLETMAFGFVQLAFVPFLLDQSLLLVAVVGHVAAVIVVTTLSIGLLYRNRAR